MVKVVLHTEAHPEDNAMLQALYSRSAESVTDHIEKLRTVGSGKFMSQYYLGYGHASIADCGFITVYVEGVSMLCAKAIQDDALYNGQESSSRYIDWTNQPFLNSFRADSQIGQDSEELLSEMREFYINEKPVLIEHLKQQFPKKDDEKETVYEKAITAKAFDILRGYLPCGSATNVAWTTSLRKANERLASLALHPLEEVRIVAVRIHAQLIAAYPNSIGELPTYAEAPPYLKAVEHYYEVGYVHVFSSYGCAVDLAPTYIEHYGRGTFNTTDSDASNVKNRPRRAHLTKYGDRALMRITVDAEIDFGSYRDIQRHRNNYCSMPMVKACGGFKNWYYDQLPSSSQNVAEGLFDSIEVFVKKYGNEKDFDLNMQYLLPMGTVIPLVLDMKIDQAIYLAELRSSQTVHATLRPLAQDLGHYLENTLAIPTFSDFSGDSWNTRRGSQDIIKKAV
jgi:thymidylate synthase ThyX